MSSLYILDIRPLSDVELVNIFFQSVGCYFVLMTVFFALQKLLNFMRSHLSIVDLRAWAIGVLFRKLDGEMGIAARKSQMPGKQEAPRKQRG